MKLPGHIISAIVVAILAASCSFMHDDQPVARVGKTVLYKSQVEKYVPAGLPAADSAALAQQYIKSWASELIMNAMASEQLSRAELDVTRELADYKNSLLKYRYEQHYIESRLDTVVTAAQIEEDYVRNASLYKLTVPIAKARYMRIPATSPMKDKFKKLMTSDKEEDIYLLDSLSYSSADRYTRYGDKWVDMVTIAREYGTDYGTLIAAIKDKYIDIVDEQGVEHITYLATYIPSGKVPPIEYWADKIREVIVSRRKYALSTNLEEDLLKNALEKGQFVIYEDEQE